MSKTFKDQPEVSKWTKNKKKRDIGQNKRIKKDYLKNREDEDN